MEKACPETRPQVAVVVGGPSREAAVSRVTGRGVAAALEGRFPRVRLLELGPDLPGELAPSGEVVFPALHGPPGEDGTFQGLLEVLGVPYVGSGVRASALAMDKQVAKLVFARGGLPVLPDRRLEPGCSGAELDEAWEALGSEVVVKPVGQGSALGVSFAASRGELEKRVRAAFGDQSGGGAAGGAEEALLLEPRVTGREVTCGILEGHLDEVLPVCEIATPEGAWYDYQHRYTEGLSEHHIPAPLGGVRNGRIQEIARRAHGLLGCRDLSRADFVVPEEGEPVLLEVNTLPGMTPTSLFPDEARAVGLSFEDLVEHLVLRAWRRRVGSDRGEGSGA